MGVAVNPLIAILGNGRPLRGVLVRRIPARLVEVSLTGCLIETPERVPAGSAGALQVRVAGQTHADDVRVSRCVFVEGAGHVFRSGAEFLWTHRPGEQSLRHAARRIQDAAPEARRAQC